MCVHTYILDLSRRTETINLEERGRRKKKRRGERGEWRGGGEEGRCGQKEAVLYC